MSSIRTAIYGSCVTRDIFAFNEPHSFDIVLYVARNSFASAFNGISSFDTFSKLLQSNFRRKCTEIDIRKKLPGLLAETDYDILIIDIVDTRFKLFKFDSGGLLALPEELAKHFNSGRYSNNGNFVYNESDEYFDLWVKGWKKFIYQCKGANKLDRIIINKVYYASSNKSKKSCHDSSVHNLFLDRLYDVIQDDIPSSNIVSFNQDIFISNAVHKWGEAPFHYIDAYYKQAFLYINEISKRLIQRGIYS